MFTNKFLVELVLETYKLIKDSLASEGQKLRKREEICNVLQMASSDFKDLYKLALEKRTLKGDDYQSLYLNALFFLKLTDLMLAILDKLKPTEALQYHLSNHYLYCFTGTGKGTFNDIILSVQALQHQLSLDVQNEQEMTINNDQHLDIVQYQTLLNAIKKNEFMKHANLNATDIIHQYPGIDRDYIRCINEICKNILVFSYAETIIPEAKVSKRGGTALVLMGLDLDNREFRAIKAVQRKQDGTDQTHHMLEREFYIIKSLEGSIYVPTVFSFNNEFITMKYYSLGSLNDYLKPNSYQLFKSGLTAQYTFDAHLLKGLAYIHQKNIRHGDIKPDNILLEVVNGELIPVYIDFGSAIKHNEKVFNLGISLYYAAPELLHAKYQDQSYQATIATDIFSLSLMLAVISLEGSQQQLNRYVNSRWDFEKHLKFVSELITQVHLKTNDAVFEGLLNSGLRFFSSVRSDSAKDLADRMDKHIKSIEFKK